MDTDFGRNAFKMSNWKVFTKNSLRGFFTLTLPSGLVIHGVGYHVKSSSRWISLPATKITKKDGSTTYNPIVEFVDRKHADEFRDLCVEALDLEGVS